MLRPFNRHCILFPLMLAGALSLSLHAYAKENAVTIEAGQSGLASLRDGNTDFLSDGEFRVNDAVLRQWDGTKTHADLANRATWDTAKRLLTRTYSWGNVSCLYATQANKLNLTIAVENTSDEIVDGVELQPLELRFPQAPQGWTEDVPVLEGNGGTPTAILASFAQGAVCVCNEDVGRPLVVGFPGRKSLTVRPLLVSSLSSMNAFGGVAASTNSLRPIYPGGKDTYHLSVRFGVAGASRIQLAGDVLAKFAQIFPETLRWSDRRAIGALHLSTSEADHHSPTNPRGWFGDAQNVDVITETGRVAFAKRLFEYADTSIKVLRDNNAQGMIVWDIEGQQYPHATSYLGDPRSLPPEMENLADQFFAKFKAAGLRTGITIRPQIPVCVAYGDNVSQIDVPDAAYNLIQKIEYARKRWGCTLFYVDSNVQFDVRRPGNDGDAYRLMDASVFQEVAAKFPDVLLIPEHENTRYYAYTAPYNELRQNATGTPSSVTDVYPGAWSVIYVPDGPIDQKRAELVAAVKHGDILMFRGWWPDEFNAKVKSIYNDAGK